MKNCSWICPFCNRDTTITNEDVGSDTTVLWVENAEGKRAVTCDFIVCPNEKCKKVALSATLWDYERASGFSKGVKLLNPLKTWQLIPQSKAQSFPDYIPQAILDDYNEACLIKDLSPKASATLARRCLQGIIRDFWKVKPSKLANEIGQIKDRVESLTWQAIDAVRSVGNIGAHMEEDVNLIVDIAPNEAELLINLIETLLKDWYIARHERETRLQALAQLGADKKTARNINDSIS